LTIWRDYPLLRENRSGRFLSGLPIISALPAEKNHSDENRAQAPFSLSDSRRILKEDERKNHFPNLEPIRFPLDPECAAMPKEAKLGLILGVGLVLLITILMFRRDREQKMPPPVPATVAAEARQPIQLSPTSLTATVPTTNASGRTVPITDKGVRRE
jgi:hypothetical protein